MSDDIGVALVKRACPVCAEVLDAEIILNTVLSKRRAAEVKKLHGECIGFLDAPCAECQEFMRQGIILVTIDESKTTDHSNPYRTGGFFVIKEEAIKRIFNAEMAARLVETRVGFIEHEAAVQLNLLEAETKTG